MKKRTRKIKYFGYYITAEGVANKESYKFICLKTARITMCVIAWSNKIPGSCARWYIYSLVDMDTPMVQGKV